MPRNKADRTAAAKRGWDKRRARAEKRATQKARRSEAAKRGWENRRARRLAGDLAGELGELQAGAIDWEFDLEEEERFGDEQTTIVEDPVVKTGKKKQ